MTEYRVICTHVNIKMESCDEDSEHSFCHWLEYLVQSNIQNSILHVLWSNWKSHGPETYFGLKLLAVINVCRAGASFLFPFNVQAGPPVLFPLVSKFSTVDEVLGMVLSFSNVGVSIIPKNFLPPGLNICLSTKLPNLGALDKRFVLMMGLIDVSRTERAEYANRVSRRSSRTAIENLR